MGECVPSSMVVRDSGVGDASADGPRTDAARTDVPRTDGAVVRDTGASADVDDTPVVLAPSSRGCRCSTMNTRVDTRWVAAAFAAGAVLVTRRRRRR